MISTLLCKSLVAVVRTYQFLLSPWLGQHCRFTPTCSHYAIAAINQFGAGKGLVLTCKRLAKCHPWHPGGFDPVPKHSATDKELVKK